MTESVMIVAARIREILENVGLAQESLTPNVVSSAQVLANMANLLNIRDTELSRWVGFVVLHLLSVSICLGFHSLTKGKKIVAFL